MILRLVIDAGDMKPSPAISQKLGPLGINLGKLIQDINKATASFKGIRVPVAVDIDTKTKNFKAEVGTPATSELLKRELGLEKGSGTPNTIKVANASLEQIVAIAKIKQEGMLVNDFKAAVKSVLGSCISLGILVENREAKEIAQELGTNKEYIGIVNNQSSSTPPEKRARLDDYFTRLKAKQDEMLKKKAEEEAAKEAEKAATATAAGTPVAAKKEEKAATTPAKAAEKVAEKPEEKKK